MNATEIISILIAIIGFAAILWIGLGTSILRAGKDKPYSFHRLQTWLWTMLICPCFALNWGFVNPSAPDVNLTALVLLSMSGGTAAIAEMVNSVHLESQRKQPGISLKLNSDSSGSFWTDILMDDSGNLSIGRLQNLVFTFVYLAVYLSMFFPEMKFPVFEKTAYVLMGISSGSFLIGKGLNK
ncbi:hypothetical protein [Taibaiella helva]|uniref:hypothetical protein n=1 Tax=Taibaiella helva TaxID=2301235 RepID=UPI000E596BCC|nr:hypothetical protein [Taibaiella helva]